VVSQPVISEQARLHVVTGKGGTGKTTVAAALALYLAGLGKRVLLVEVEGRQAIAQLFDVPALPYEEQRLASAANGGSLWGLAVDAEEAMIEYLDMFYGLRRSARGLKKMGAIDFVTTLAPGLRDVLLSGKLKEAVSRVKPDAQPTYDAVVLDAPPTGRIEKFLNATQEVANLTKVGPLSKHSTGVVELLHSPVTVVHLVTLLEEMPVQETIDAATALRKDGYVLGAVIVNRVRPDLGTSEIAIDVELLAEGLARVEISREHAGALAEEVHLHDLHQRTQRENAERLAEIELPQIELPDLNPPVDIGELSTLARAIAKAKS
jgi:anion-transporting  ArsA/GET3 family ATPase